jgi:hypothetical protein
MSAASGRTAIGFYKEPLPEGGGRALARPPARSSGKESVNFDTRHNSFGVLSPDWQVYFPCPQVNRLRLEMVQTACKSNVVYAVIAGTVTPYKEPVSAW